MKQSRIDSLRELLLYGGMTREEYNQITGEIQSSNRKNLLVYTAVAGVYLICMYFLSFFSGSISANRYVYFGATLVVGAIFAAAKCQSQKHPRVLLVCIYVFISVLYTFGIVLGTISNTDQLAVTFVAALLAVPLLFTDCPVRMVASIGVFVLAFMPVVFLTKTGYVRTIDIIDVAMFGTMSMITSTYMMRVKCQRILFEQRALMLSQTDVLTGLYNRNLYERSLAGYPARCRESLSCIFVDVDGLHELNNTRGHAAGDEMLRFVAEGMRKRFGAEHTYRIGGDEFVAFVPDRPEPAISEALEDLRRSVEGAGYHVAIGCVTEKREKIDMMDIIRDAETRMYQAKKQYYAEKGIIRDIR